MPGECWCMHRKRKCSFVGWEPDKPQEIRKKGYTPTNGVLVKRHLRNYLTILVKDKIDTKILNKVSRNKLVFCAHSPGVLCPAFSLSLSHTHRAVSGWHDPVLFAVPRLLARIFFRCPKSMARDCTQPRLLQCGHSAAVKWPRPSQEVTNNIKGTRAQWRQKSLDGAGGLQPTSSFVNSVCLCLCGFYFLVWFAVAGFVLGCLSSLLAVWFCCFVLSLVCFDVFCFVILLIALVVTLCWYFVVIELLLYYIVLMFLVCR